MDVLVPRDLENRYRIYAVGPHVTKLVATGPGPDEIFQALVTLKEEGQFAPHERVGILDTRGREGVAGVWLVNPWD